VRLMRVKSCHWKIHPDTCRSGCLGENKGAGPGRASGPGKRKHLVRPLNQREIELQQEEELAFKSWEGGSPVKSTLLSNCNQQTQRGLRKSRELFKGETLDA